MRQVNPPQAEVPDVYRRGYHCHVFFSVYEGWGMPAMEVSAVPRGVYVCVSVCV